VEYRANKFIDLAENLVDTHQDALNHALEGKNFVSDGEVDRIYNIIKAYMPKIRPVFENICENCPAYLASQRLQNSIGRNHGLDMSGATDEVIDFIITLSRQSEPVKSRVFLMAIADFSTLYCKLTAGGRLNADDRIRRGLKALLQGLDRMIYVGSGVFLFFFEKAAESYVIPKKQAILDTVFGLVGEKAGGHAAPGAVLGTAAAEGAGLIDVAFHGNVDLEKHMKRAIDALAEAQPRGLDGAAGAVNHPGFDQITRQLTFHYAPVWDARACAVSLYQLESLREIEPGVFLRGEDVLTRKRGDEFHYRFQLYKLNHGFSTVLTQESQPGAIGRTPSLLVPFSLESVTGVPADQFESDIHDIFGFHSGDRLVVMLKDIGESLPRNLFIRVIAALKKRKVRLFCKAPFTHSYFNLLANVEGMAVCFDVNDVLKFGFEIDVVEHLIQEFARYAKARHVQPMITSVDASTISGIAYKAGYYHIAGKVVGETRPTMNPVTDVPASRILLKS